ncbi:hypothetical protein [Nannocystis bainbridge]|uniref:Tryptophan synthase alpha chain n=1 Tax=Nannocystis bainbridge TaxID=2995303 RepID=A0ABT5E7P7_9BACT|nr:hypothetical protein [Nannocystis bainbridge]MDC0721430.1 hypothetical protein [Nannocystis bainbridge]
MRVFRSFGPLVWTVVSVVACGSDSNATDTATGVEAENPREVCDRYLVCIAAVAPAGLPAAQMGFGDDGSCWKGSDKDARLCIDACGAGLKQYHELFPGRGECDLCQDHDDCDRAAGELCYQGECTVTTCGNGVVEDDEICDSAQSACDADCQGPSACNPLSGYGCESDACALYAVGGSDPGIIAQCAQFTVIPAGEACQMTSLGLCEPGFACTSPSQLPTCDPGGQDGCCARLCMVNAATECAEGEDCVAYAPPLHTLPADLDYVGVCVPG